jgi:hypothetical protein
MAASRWMMAAATRPHEQPIDDKAQQTIHGKNLMAATTRWQQQPMTANHR